MSYEVVIEPLGEAIMVEEGQTVLDAALRQGIHLPHACGHGLCSTCKVEVLEGEVDCGEASPFALMDFERQEGMCLACCAKPRSDLVIEADVEEEEDALRLPVRDFLGTVTRIEDLTPRIKLIMLTVGGEGIDFQAGQYVNLIVPGCEAEPRAFSIANPPSERHSVELNVARVEGGAATCWLHERLSVGDEMRFSGPYGRFYVRRSAPEPMLFLAGGSGLSSLKSMLLDLLEKGESRPMTLIYGARNQAELYYRSLFDELARRHANFEFLPVLSEEPNGSGWAGLRGFVHEAANRVFDGKLAGRKAYLCGPPPMIDACVTALMRGRLFERDIFMENFYSRKDREAQPRSPLFRSIA